MDRYADTAESSTKQNVDTMSALTLTKTCREQTEKLAALIGELEDRLKPVLVSPHPTAVDETQPAPEVSPLVNELYAHGDHIGSLQRKVRHLIDRVQA